jgi:hypothetical protein
MTDERTTSEAVAAWGEAWLAEWVASGLPQDREQRDGLANLWRKVTLAHVVEEWRKGRADPKYLESFEAWKRYEVNHSVGNLIGLYKMTLNGLVIWRIYREYREEGLAVPEAILEKFDQWATRLEHASGAPEVAAAIQMTGSKGGAQGAAALKRAEHRRQVASDVHQLLDFYKGRIRPSEAFSRVARLHRMKVSEVKAVWNRWNKEIREADRDATASTTDEVMHRLAGGKVRQLRS